MIGKFVVYKRAMTLPTGNQDCLFLRVQIFMKIFAYFAEFEFDIQKYFW